MIPRQTAVGANVWFLEGVFLRRGRIVAMVDAEIAIRCGDNLVVRKRADAWTSESTAVKSKLDRVTNQISVLQTERISALGRLAELAGIEDAADESAADCCT